MMTMMLMSKELTEKEMQAEEFRPSMQPNYHWLHHDRTLELAMGTKLLRDSRKFDVKTIDPYHIFLEFLVLLICLLRITCAAENKGILFCYLYFI